MSKINSENIQIKQIKRWQRTKNTAGGGEGGGQRFPSSFLTELPELAYSRHQAHKLLIWTTNYLKNYTLRQTSTSYKWNEKKVTAAAEIDTNKVIVQSALLEL